MLPVTSIALEIATVLDVASAIKDKFVAETSVPVASVNVILISSYNFSVFSVTKSADNPSTVALSPAFEDKTSASIFACVTFSVVEAFTVTSEFGSLASAVVNASDTTPASTRFEYASSIPPLNCKLLASANIAPFRLVSDCLSSTTTTIALATQFASCPTSASILANVSDIP